LVQLIKQTELRREVRPVSRRVKLFERDRHATAAGVRNENLRYATPVRSRTLSTSGKGIVRRWTSSAATLQRGFSSFSALRSLDRSSALYSQLRWIRFACDECGKSETACRA
jgi:hypothetical protein